MKESAPLRTPREATVGIITKLVTIIVATFAFAAFSHSPGTGKAAEATAPAGGTPNVAAKE